MINVRVVNAHRRYRLAKKPFALSVKKVLKKEGIRKAMVSIIFIDSMVCRKMNKKHLHHDYGTDVLSFDYEQPGTLEGEVYVNLDQAGVQAKNYNASFTEEVRRLVIHGTLHLAGSDDRTSLERKHMRKKEDEYLGVHSMKKGKRG